MALVRLKLECYEQVIACVKQDTELLERAERTTSRLILRIPRPPYDDSLPKPDFLLYRRMGCDVMTDFRLLDDDLVLGMTSFYKGA